MSADLDRSRALWNRTALELESREILAQLLDRGELWAWRELYARARTDAALRRRLHEVVRQVPLAHGHFWLAALASLGEAVDWGAPLPRSDGSADI